MSTDLIKQLNAAKSKVAALEKKISTQQHREFAKLPARYGFGSMNEFIVALQAVGGKPVKKAASAAAKPTGRKPRAKITPETKAEVKKLAEAGKTGAEIAHALNISLPSVQNIKKSLGLVKARK